jgi:hypothetical protein
VSARSRAMARVVRMLAAERNGCRSMVQSAPAGPIPCPVSEACERTAAPQGRAVHGRSAVALA